MYSSLFCPVIRGSCSQGLDPFYIVFFLCQLMGTKPDQPHSHNYIIQNIFVVFNDQGSDVVGNDHVGSGLEIWKA